MKTEAQMAVSVGQPPHNILPTPWRAAGSSVCALNSGGSSMWRQSASLRYTWTCSRTDRLLFLTKNRSGRSFLLSCLILFLFFRVVWFHFPLKESGFDVLCFSAPDRMRQLLSCCGSRYLHPSRRLAVPLTPGSQRLTAATGRGRVREGWGRGGGVSLTPVLITFILQGVTSCCCSCARQLAKAYITASCSPL